MMHRHTCSIVLWGVLGSLVPAQDDAGKPTGSPFGDVLPRHVPTDRTEEPAWTLWVAETSARGSFADHRAYLEDLQQKYAEQGLRIAVTFPREQMAEALAMTSRLWLGESVPAAAEEPTEPELGGVVLELVEDVVVGTPMAAALVGRNGEVAWVPGDLDGMNDVLPKVLRGEGLGDDQGAELLNTVVYNIGDGEVPQQQTDALVRAMPHAGKAHAMVVLQAWWCRGDYQAARQAIDAGCKALAGDAVPMCLFADLVLRGDHFDDTVARRFAAEMAPVAALIDGPFTQLVYLRALLRAGQDRIAGRMIARLPKRLEGLPEHQLRFAETLMDAREPAPFRDLAERSLAAAEAAGHDSIGVQRCRFKILSRCGDTKAAEELIAAQREDGNAMSLNNMAWYAMTRLDSMGRFDDFALAQCREMQRLEGDSMSYGNQDTVALALFLGGLVDEAVELQTAASQAAGGDPRYQARLTRYLAVQGMRAAAKPPAEPR